MNIEEAIKILDYKINMYKEDVFIGDLDKTNIEAIKKVLEEIERLNNIINEFEDRFKMIKKIVQDNILEELDDISYACMMSTIDSVCDGKPGFLAFLNKEKE